MTTITRGAQFVSALGVAVTGAAVLPDLSTTPITYVLDTADQSRHVFKWRPAGVSDSQFSMDVPNNQLIFTLTGTWTNDNLSVGQGALSVLQGDPPDVQNPIGKVVVQVVNLPLGAAPLT